MAKHDKTIRQAAVMAIRQGQICLITSSSGKRWLLPKGNRAPGKNLHDTARQEAWEEAGVLGRLGRRPVGRYRFQKLGRDYSVVVFAMQVTEVKRDWPERKHRRRLWVRPKEALHRIRHAPLCALIGSVIRRRAA